MSRARPVAVVTGSRAEFGLLSPVMRAIDEEAGLSLRVVAAGSHLVGERPTVGEVEASFGVSARVPMQIGGAAGRAADAAALGRGVSGFAAAFSELLGDEGTGWVVVLGDRIEAFAAASAASVGGHAVAHIHGGDRAEGVADEAMRHAISKLAHLHLPATEESAERLRRLGECEDRIVRCGSPAACGIDAVRPGLPGGLDEGVRAVVLMHGAGLGDERDAAWAEAVVAGLDDELGAGEVAAVGSANLDPGSAAVVGVLDRAVAEKPARFVRLGHVGHGVFRSLLRWVGDGGGVLIGNSSAGLIEAPMLGCASVDVGPRQGGRECGESVVRVGLCSAEAVAAGVRAARSKEVVVGAGRYSGPGGADPAACVARALLAVDPTMGGFVRKRNAY